MKELLLIYTHIRPTATILYATICDTYDFYYILGLEFNEDIGFKESNQRLQTTGKYL